MLVPRTQKVVVAAPDGAGLRGYCIDTKAHLRWRVRPNGQSVHDRVMWVGDWTLSPLDRVLHSNGVVYKLPEHRA